MINFEKLIHKNQKKALQNKHRLAPTWDNNQTFRLLLTGPSGCGKTNTLLNMVLRLMNFDEIHLLTKDTHEPSYEFLRKTIEPVEKELKHKILYMYNNKNDLPNVQDLNKNTYKIVIFDDQVNDKDQEKIIDYFTLGRKERVGCVYLSQSFFKTPLIVRQNCNYFVLFSLPSNGDLCRISREIANDIDKNEFKQLMIESCKNQGDSLMIDKKGDRKKPYRKNIIEPLKTTK